MRHAFPPDASVEWAYFLDIDGTLIDIATTPDAVRVDSALLDLITHLHCASGNAVALISGRTISDVESRLGMPRLPLAAALWPGDEDLPGRAAILFDASASHYLTTDGLALLGSGLASRLLRGADVH